MSRAVLHCGDVRAVLGGLPEASVQCVVTSPPYWGLRDYGMPGQLGLEPTPDRYVSNMVAVFGEVRRVLRDDGVLWLNLGDSYSIGPSGRRDHGVEGSGSRLGPSRDGLPGGTRIVASANRPCPPGLKPKDLVGIPWRVAFALQADGWWLRSDVIWSKPNPMPESVTDRPTKSHEYLFLLTKGERYYYDAQAIAEDATCGRLRGPGPMVQAGSGRNDGTEHGDYRVRRSVKRGGFDGKTNAMPGREAFRAITDTRNARSVWTIATQSYPEAHFATFPEELARRCILAGSRPGHTVLDPFGGSGTVAQVATGNGRDAIYIDLNPGYLDLARHRIGPMLCGDAA